MWTCQRRTGGVKCGFRNDSRHQVCRKCAKRKPPRKRPAHLKALELPYEEYVAINHGVEVCGICGAEPGTKRLHRDHDHRTGRPRGLLCFRCNSALRPYMTDRWLLAAWAYVERTQDERAA